MVRRPTIIDVARLANVSKSTVARVVNGEHDRVREETRQRVVEAIEQLGYERNVIAGSLRNDKTYMVALCIPDITNPFWPEVVRGAQDTIEDEGYAVVTVNSDWRSDREANYLRMVRRNRFDGLIINPTSITNDVLASLDIPVVILGSGSSFPAFDSVGSDTEAGAQYALEHLYDLGHRRIGLIAGISARGKLHHSRRQSFITFHARKHIQLDEALIIESEFSDQAGYDAMQQFLSLDQPPTAIFAANDLLAIGALKAAQALGCRVPDQLSIVGMDDIYAAATTSPALTTVTKPKIENGVQAAKYLLERMANQGSKTPRHTKIPCHLTIRESTAVPPG
ncbi:MAG: LacI family DNA-binding transcriptional regulator [Anaerolineae bacterium]|nr:LacI family DNA-binding transcriptional regulator [Anaerolineae bacterium]